jgi:Helix-turn-helix domain
MISKTIAGSVSKRFYSERDLAEVLGVSIKTLQGHRLRGIGAPWKKIQGSIRYPVEMVDAWLAAQPGGGGAA